MNKSLTSWRGILAVIVMLFHYQMHWFDQLVTFAVSFFFVASGFLLTRKYHFDRLTCRQWFGFAFSRACFFYPLHWLVLAFLIAIYWVFQPHLITVPTLVPHILLLQGWFPGHEMHFGYNGASWFLGALLFCYWCFPVLRRYFSGMRLSWQMGVVAAFMLGWFAVLPMMTEPWREWAYVFPLARLGDFVLGMALAGFARFLRGRRIPLNRLCAVGIGSLPLVLALSVTAMCRYTVWLTPWDGFLVWWLPVAALVLASDLLDARVGIFNRMLHCPVLVGIGTVSFEIYLLHLAVSVFTNYLVAPVFGHFGVMIYGKMLWLNVTLVVLVSVAFHKWVSVPLRHRTKAIGWVRPAL